eukprot:COSAG02_NODE_1122_length_14450_cov_4.124173_3_plen_58_part_00
MGCRTWWWRARKLRISSKLTLAHRMRHRLQRKDRPRRKWTLLLRLSQRQQRRSTGWS